MQKVGVFLTLCIVTLSSCTMRVDSYGGKPVDFTELPKEVQDTILYWTKSDEWIPYTESNDTTELYEYYEPNIICFDDQYTLRDVTFGPWTWYKLLTRTSDDKEYKLASNAPVPIIVKNDSIIIPDDYCILAVWDPAIKWTIYKLPQ